mmetsp:Transcript_31191/g.72078  ORF Transcript_31191/g.72078 Transcript_31191/m.72078 type:complete len:341 (+) Transcript_31191:147-1169(+)
MLERFRSKTSSKKAQQQQDAQAPAASDAIDEERSCHNPQTEDGGDWRLGEEESGEDEILQVRSSNAGLATSSQAGVAAATSPRSGTSTVASYSQKEPLPGGIDVVVPAGSSLLDGLRLLLVHHLKGSAGTEQISLTTGQAELLEHHLARLASYAQKIVHTLAFATRFLSTQPREEEDQSQNASGSLPLNVSENPAEQSTGVEATVSAEPRKRSTLRLKDRELLQIYRSAQLEASREADWRGLDPSPSCSVGSEGSDFSDASWRGATLHGQDAELLKALSRAMRQPGRSPEALAAEIVEVPSSIGCCRSQKAMVAQQARASSAMVRWPQSPPDPGGQRRGW